VDSATAKVNHLRRKTTPRIAAVYDTRKFKRNVGRADATNGSGGRSVRAAALDTFPVLTLPLDRGGAWRSVTSCGS